FPAVAVAGPAFVMERSAAVATAVLTDAELLAALGSFDVVLTLAVSVRVEPSGALLARWSTISNTAVTPAGKLAIVAVVVPVPPTPGLVTPNAGPESCVSDTNVAPA